MSATSQHGFHPDAESLSAFSEQALSGRERAEMLSHLAVCARCRKVVALAGEAADADVVTTSAKPRKKIEPSAWWKQWRMVWVPTAIVAAFAATSISVYIVQTDRHGSGAGIAQHNTTPDAAPVSTPAPAEQAQATPPASPAAEAPPAHSAKRTHAVAAEPGPAPAWPASAAQMQPEPGAADHVQAMNELSPPTSAQEQQAPPGSAGGAGSAYPQPAAAPWDAKQKRSEEQRQAQADTTRTRTYAARHAPVAGFGTNQPAAPASSETVTVAAAPPMPAPESPPSADKVSGLYRSRASLPAKQIHLPSGLAAVSSTSMGVFVLAIDKAGALFVSSDQGDTWERVHRQWKGRAVEVTQHFAATAGLPSAPDTETETAPNTPANAVAVSPPTVIFELLNNKGQAWVSTDGRAWTAK